MRGLYALCGDGLPVQHDHGKESVTLRRVLYAPWTPAGALIAACGLGMRRRSELDGGRVKPRGAGVGVGAPTITLGSRRGRSDVWRSGTTAEDVA